MDPQGSPQDVQRCDLCMNTIADSYCDFCLVNLCKPCIGEHISDEYDKHKKVPFRHRKSTLIYLKCGTHPHKIFYLQCKNCNIFEKLISLSYEKRAFKLENQLASVDREYEKIMTEISKRGEEWHRDCQQNENQSKCSKGVYKRHFTETFE